MGTGGDKGFDRPGPRMIPLAGSRVLRETLCQVAVASAPGGAPERGDKLRQIPQDEVRPREGLEDPWDLRIRLRPHPLLLEPLYVRRRVCLHLQVPEHPREAHLRRLDNREERVVVDAEEVVVPPGKEFSRADVEEVVPDDAGRDSQQRVLTRVDDRAERVKRDRPDPVHRDPPNASVALWPSRPIVRTHLLQWAHLAPRPRATDLLRVADEEGVVFPEEREVPREAGLEPGLQYVVLLSVSPPERAGDPDRVRIHEERRRLGRVEEDRVRGFRSHALLREEVLPDDCGG